MKANNPRGGGMVFFREIGKQITVFYFESKTITVCVAFIFYLNYKNLIISTQRNCMIQGLF